MSVNTREIILDILLELEKKESKSHLLIRDVLLKYDYLDARDKGLIKRISEGTVFKKITLDFVLDKYSKKPMSKCKPEVAAILRMSLYQILFMDKIPDNAVCDEAVKLCRKKSFETFCPFVNGILRNVCRDKESALSFDDIEDRVQRISVTYSCPEWIVKMLLKEQDDGESLIKALSDIRPTFVKILRHEDAAGLLKDWDGAGIEYRESRYIEDAYSLEGFEGMESVPGFSDGKFLIQDESSMISASCAGVSEGDDLRILDVCAAPGGKSSYVASRMFPHGEVVSCDVSDYKVSMISENAERMGLTNLKPTLQDATEFNKEFEGAFDIVIADVPCSGLGVMSRKSDIKYKISNEAMKDICDLQKAIVSNVSKYVKSGGVMIYSTCTIHKAENEKMVKFITDNLGLKEDSLKPFVPFLFDKPRKSDSHIQLRPDVDGTDGFFVARFVKSED
ncbi:MAG: 16S rRNA (cytosine(967)-C(5))-methyltransferase RsmB [Lachnospiraceae bacterium]|nr:16S rRNA (cytosine(967)-C(5))-methyltransferase RsmB [Lachnospiraceae bacterium]